MTMLYQVAPNTTPMTAESMANTLHEAAKELIKLQKENLDLVARNAQLEKEKSVLIHDITMKWHTYEQTPSQGDDYVQTYINDLLKDCKIN